MRTYANGYLRNEAGQATATVSQLEPDTTYEFAISSYCDLERTCPQSEGHEMKFYFLGVHSIFLVHHNILIHFNRELIRV